MSGLEKKAAQVIHNQRQTLAEATDFFEIKGWDTHYLGVNTPTHDIVRTATEREADVLVVSATITPRVKAVADLTAKVRASQVDRGFKILTGGYPFNATPNLWLQVGAHGCAHNAQGRAGLANRLVADGDRA